MGFAAPLPEASAAAAAARARSASLGSGGGAPRPGPPRGARVPISGRLLSVGGHPSKVKNPLRSVEAWRQHVSKLYHRRIEEGRPWGLS